MKILIAEDDLVSRECIFNILKDYGSCSLASDGIQAVDIFMENLSRNEPFDLISMDVMMPRVDGLKAVQIIRDQEKARGIKQVKILITTALGKTKHITDSIRSENDIYIEKPIQKKELINALRRLSLI